MDDYPDFSTSNIYSVNQDLLDRCLQQTASSSSATSELQSPTPAKKRREEKKLQLRYGLENGTYTLQPLSEEADFMQWIIEGDTKLGIFCGVCEAVLSKTRGGSLTEHTRVCRKARDEQAGLQAQAALNAQIFQKKSSPVVIVPVAPKKRRLDDEKLQLRYKIEDGTYRLESMSMKNDFMQWIFDGDQRIGIFCQVCEAILSKTRGGSLSEHARVCREKRDAQLGIFKSPGEPHAGSLSPILSGLMTDDLIDSIPAIKHEIIDLCGIADTPKPITLPPTSLPKSDRKEQIRSLILNGTFRLEPLTAVNNFINWIYDQNERIGIYCQVCDAVLSKTRGGSLTDHINNCRKALLSQEGISTAVIQEDNFISQILDSMASNLLPSTLFANQGLVDIIQSAIAYGYSAKSEGNELPNVRQLFGDKPSEILPSKLDEIVKANIADLHSHIQLQIQNSGASLSIDSMSFQEKFAGYSIQFIDDHFNTNVYPVDLKDFNSNLDPTAVMTQLGLDPSNVEVVAPQNFMIKGPIEAMVPCAYQALYDIMTQTFDSKAVNINTAVSKISYALENCLAIIKAIEANKTLSSLLSVSFRQKDKLWFNELSLVHKFLTLCSYEHDLVYTHLRGSSMWNTYIELSNDLEPLRVYAQLLDLFKTTIEALDTHTSPTLQLVIPLMFELQNQLEAFANDPHSEVLSHAAQALWTLLQEKIGSTITIKHQLALILDPLNKLKLYEIYGDEKLENIKQIFENEVQRVLIPTSQENTSNFNPFTKLKNGFLEAASELHVYYNEVVNPQGYDIATWWRENGHRYPRISKIAKKILCIPASSLSMNKFFEDTTALVTTENDDYLTNVVLYKAMKIAKIL